jgi:hypothetical protein
MEKLRQRQTKSRMGFIDKNAEALGLERQDYVISADRTKPNGLLNTDFAKSTSFHVILSVLRSMLHRHTRLKQAPPQTPKFIVFFNELGKSSKFYRS